MSENEIEISIVVPFHRIPEDIESISLWLGLIPNSYEVILVHDIKRKALESKSLYELSGMHSNLKVIEGVFNSPGAARNAGLEVVQGKYLAFWDSDDYPILDNFEEMVKFAQTEKSDCVVGGYIRVDKEERLVVPSKDRLLELIGIEPGMWRILFLSDVAKNVRFPEINLGEDQIFLNLVDGNVQKYNTFRFPVYKYRCNNPNQITSSKCDPKDLIYIIQRLLRDAQKNGEPSSKLFNYMIIRISLTFMKNLNAVNISQLKQVLSILRTAKILSEMKFFEILRFMYLFVKIQWVR
jgi:glycosyltransferase involved in cell wall biosynthesis